MGIEPDHRGERFRKNEGVILGIIFTYSYSALAPVSDDCELGVGKLGAIIFLKTICYSVEWNRYRVLVLRIILACLQS